MCLPLWWRRSFYRPNSDPVSIVWYWSIRFPEFSSFSSYTEWLSKIFFRYSRGFLSIVHSSSQSWSSKFMLRNILIILEIVNPHWTLILQGCLPASSERKQHTASVHNNRERSNRRSDVDFLPLTSTNHVILPYALSNQKEMWSLILCKWAFPFHVNQSHWFKLLLFALSTYRAWLVQLRWIVNLLWTTTCICLQCSCCQWKFMQCILYFQCSSFVCHFLGRGGEEWVEFISTGLLPRNRQNSGNLVTFQEMCAIPRRAARFCRT